MSYDIVVVGGGIGGLTVAALLSARGLDVCLVERQSQVGGCISPMEFGGKQFDPGMGVYYDWGSGEIHDVIFSELGGNRPSVRPIGNQIVVRLSEQADIPLCRDWSEFSAALRRIFPECANEAVRFYESLRKNVDSERTHRRYGSSRGKLFKRLRDWMGQRPVSQSGNVLSHLRGTSSPFCNFINAQLAALAHTNVHLCSFAKSSLILGALHSEHYIIDGGPSQVCDFLAESFRASGGKLRLNSPALRLAYDESGNAIGVELLSGETLLAKRAIVSNMTIWDTYGKLIGLNRTPPEIKHSLDKLNTDGAYLLFASASTEAIDRLPSPRMLMIGREKAEKLGEQDDEPDELMFAVQVGPLNTERLVTVKSRVNVNDWFTYQSGPDDLDEWDQVALEKLWERLHSMLPELGDGIEVIETSTPRAAYEQTRRKLGMVLGVRSGNLPSQSDFHTALPNVFIVGDTVAKIPTLASVSESALDLANFLTSQ